MGAPLLRTTIPVMLGTPSKARAAAKAQQAAALPTQDDDGGSDVETIISLDDCDVEDYGQLSVTLDFPC